MNLKEVIEKVGENAEKKGFHKPVTKSEDEDRTLKKLLIISEIGEMIEAERTNNYAKEIHLQEYDIALNTAKDIKEANSIFEKYIKDTYEDEMADIIIRMMDYVYQYETYEYINFYAMDQFPKVINSEKYNYLLKTIIPGIVRGTSISKFIYAMFEYAKYESVNIEFFINAKMLFNESREKLHGKKY
jgi:hypothetical protein